MSHPSKVKGNSFERECVELFKGLGLESKRAWGSNGASLGLDPEVDVVAGGKTVQCKRRKALPAYLQIPASCHCVAFRQDRGEPLVLIRLKDYAELIKE